jgi:hypothetical protein
MEAYASPEVPPMGRSRLDWLQCRRIEPAVAMAGQEKPTRPTSSSMMASSISRSNGAVEISRHCDPFTRRDRNAFSRFMMTNNRCGLSGYNRQSFSGSL